MKSFKRILKGSLAGLTVAAVAWVATSFVAANPACFQYDPSGNFTTSSTPVFNNICGDTTQINSTDGPYAIGDEPNFVRIRPDTSGDVTSNKNNPKLVNDLSSTCAAGSKFDVWTYIHNDAQASFNNNGSGSAVAHDVKLALAAAGIGSTGSNFTFKSTVSASNADTVSDTATLNCNGHQVKLTLVPSSVHYTLNVANPTYLGMPDSAVNGVTALGNPTFGSGDVWGCWDYRTVVVYQVTVSELPPQVTASCDLFNIAAADDRTVKITAFNYTAKNTTFKDATILWDANNANGAQTVVSDPSKVVGQTHQYGADGTYLVQARLHFTNPDRIVNDPGCAVQVTFSSQPPEVTKQPPKQLVNTGAGSVVGLFAAVTVAASAFYRWMLGRKLTDR